MNNKKNNYRLFNNLYSVLTTSKKQSADNSCIDKQSSLNILYQNYIACTKCPLATQGRNNIVFGTGNPYAKLMFIGEGPGRNEDLQAKPFVGQAGQLLTKIIESISLTRESVYISNVVKCRPPNNRVPLPEESTICKNALLFKEIYIIQPQIICTLGATAAKALLGDAIKISQVRGQFYNFQECLVIPTYHPAYLLRNPNEKRKVWDDMKKIKSKLLDLSI